MNERMHLFKLSPSTRHAAVGGDVDDVDQVCERQRLCSNPSGLRCTRRVWRLVVSMINSSRQGQW
jgi:hypothetical protein